MFARHTSRLTADRWLNPLSVRLMSSVFRTAWFSAWALCASVPALAEPRAAIHVSAQVIDTTPCAIAMGAIHDWLETTPSNPTIAEGDLSPAGGLLRIGFLAPTNHPDERVILIEFVAN